MAIKWLLLLLFLTIHHSTVMEESLNINKKETKQKSDEQENPNTVREFVKAVQWVKYEQSVVFVEDFEPGRVK